MTNKKTLIVGASTNPQRYAFKAALALTKHQHSIVNLGLKKGDVAGQPILQGKPALEDIDTITLYIGKPLQPDMYDYLISLKPNRIIFNPGTENSELVALAQKHQIDTIEACTLVMLATGQY